MATRRAAMWAVLALVMFALPFLSLPGRYVFDTRDSLWFHPGAYLAKVGVLWRANPYLGHEQHDGIAVPMGVIVWILRSAGLSPWGAERVWHGLLLFTAAGGMVLLVDHFHTRKTVLGPLVAGLLYSLTPYSFGYGLQFSAVFLPYVLMPLLLLVTLRGLEDRRLLWPALLGLLTFLMGGGNGAPQVYVLGTALLLALWVVFVDHGASLRRALRFGMWGLLFFVGLNAYWLFLLGSSEVSNALTFSEQPVVINVSSSLSESVRGLGFWQYYGGDQFGPWIPAVRTYVTSLPLIFAGYAIPVGALLSAWLVRWRYRVFFLLAGILAVFLASGLFPVSAPTPFGRALLWAYRHVPGVGGLRTTYKVTATVNLAFAVLAAVGVVGLWGWLGRSRGRRVLAGRVGVALVVFGVVSANAFALWTGKLYNPAHGVDAIPGYWEQALHHLDERDVRYRAFFAPAVSWGVYRWGAIKEGVSATDPTLSSVIPLRLPVGQRYGSNLVNAIEQPYLYGLPAAGSAQLLRYLGVQDVVLQNDIDWQRSHTARPAGMQRLLRDPELRSSATFGQPGENVTSPSEPEDPVAKTERSLSPVQVLTVADPLPIVRAEAASPVVISGDGFGMAAAARHGLLDSHPPVLYSGALTPAQLRSILARDHPSFVITDSNRRRVWSFTGPRSPYSYTLPAGQTLRGSTPGYLLFDSRSDTQSVAVYPGLRSITASGYGGVFGSNPQYRPSNAFDGDPSSWWEVGAGGTPLGAWVQADFVRPQTLSRVTLSLPRSPLVRDIRRVRLQFSDGTPVVALVPPTEEATITFPPHRTRSLRLRIVSLGPARKGQGGPAAIGDISIPGIHAAEIVQVPNDLFEMAQRTGGGLQALGNSPITYLFERARTGIFGQSDEELGISRRFEVPLEAVYGLTGTVRLNRSSPDTAIDSALYGPTVVQVSGSSRLLGNPSLRGGAALDGKPTTSWVPGGGVGQSLAITFPPKRVDRMTIHTDVGPARTRIQQLEVTFSDGSVVVGDVTRPDGAITLRFPARQVSKAVISISRIATEAEEGQRQPVGISEVHIPGVSTFHRTLHETIPCTRDSSYTIDGSPFGVRPIGTLEELLSGSTLPLETCDGTPIQLSAGWHNVIAHGALEPDALGLSTGASPGQGQVHPMVPAIQSDPRPDGGYSVRVRGADAPFYLVIGQNFSPHWRATIDGKDLGPPLLVDGYSAGWRVSHAGSFTIAVAYRPQRLYTLVIIVTALALLATLGVVAGSLIRRRKGRPREA